MSKPCGSLDGGQCGAIVLAVDDPTATALSLVLNRTAERSEWDYKQVAANIKALQEDSFEVGLLGWDDHELQPMLIGEWEPTKATADDDDPQDRPHALLLSPSQWDTIKRGVQEVRRSECDDAISEGRCVELIVADYLAGA